MIKINKDNSICFINNLVYLEELPEDYFTPAYKLKELNIIYLFYIILKLLISNIILIILNALFLYRVYCIYLI